MAMLASPPGTVPCQVLDIPVRGGTLRAGSWGSGEAVALALHGLTLTHAEFALLGECLAEGPGAPIRLVAPDLRGRGGSAALPAPFGLAAHVADVAAVLEHLRCPPVVLVGHSWGAVVALAVAHRHPAMVRGLVLVDGGLPPPPGADSATATARASERVLARLDTSFPSVEAYLDTWRAQPGLGPYWNPHIERTFAYELAGAPPALRCGLKPDALLADLATTYAADSLAERAMIELAHRAVLVRSGRNMADEDHPQYSDAVAQAWLDRVPRLHDMFVAGENHYTILLGKPGATIVADRIRNELGQNELGQNERA
jgi:pimeloyl-ACP methyl ester carboxylesterase